MKKIDLLRGLTDLDDRLIEEANPYTEDASAEVGGNDKSARRLTKLRVLSGIAAAVVIVVVGFVAAKNGWFKKMIPSHKGPAPVATPTLAPTTPTPTAVMGKDNTTPTPTITPREDPEPTPMGLREKVIPENARELTLSEVEQSDWYQCIPENTFLFYNIVNAYTYEDESGPCVLVRLIGVGYHQANGWRITQNGVGLTFNMAKYRAIATKAISPPDISEIVESVFPGGWHLISMPLSRILSGSSSTREAFPPPKSSLKVWRKASLIRVNCSAKTFCISS